ncbi:MAG TPA: permease-like cell division protein FtsX [Actinomycetes bacterium]|nr:permease-like cell division protein FtsX [Actinomycetes bacterium]
MRIRFVMQEIGIGLRRNLTMTVAVIVSVAVSLTLFGLALLIRAQVNQMKDYWYDKIEVSIFLCNDNSTQSLSCTNGAVTDDQRVSIQSDLNKLKPKLVNAVYYESQHQAYEQALHQFEDSPIAEFLVPEQLPESFRVKLTDPRRYREVAGQFEGRPGVAAVEDQRKILKPLFTVLSTLRNGALGLAIVMLFVAVLLIGNTMRVAAFSRRRETGIMRLVGASNFYIQLPFLLEGAVAGLIGAGLASFMVVLAKTIGIDRHLAPNFALTPFIGWDAVIGTMWVLLIFGTSMSVIASFITLRKYLRV